MSVSQTNVRELTDVISGAHNARLDRYRTEIYYTKRMIISLQNDLSNLKSAEMLILQKMNRNQKLSDIELNYSMSRFQSVDPRQAIAPTPTGGIPAPDPRLNQSRNFINQGNEALQAERDRIGNELIKVSLDLQRHRAQLLKTQENLKSIGGDISSQIDKDGIAKRLYTETYMLYEVHKKYRLFTTDQNGLRKFNADAIVLKQIQKLNLLFQAYSERNPYVLNGDIKLDYDDPGSDANKLSLEIVLDRVRQIYAVPIDAVFDDKLKKFSNKMQTELMDSYVSKELSRESDSQRRPSLSNSLDMALAAPAKAVNWSMDKITLGALKILMTWDGKSLAEAATTGFNKFISGVNNGLPFCTPKPVDKETQERVDQETKNNASEVKAGKDLRAQFEKSMNPLPQAEIEATLNSLYNALIAAEADKRNVNMNISQDPVNSLVDRAIRVNGNLFTAVYFPHKMIILKANQYLNYIIKLFSSGDIDFARYDALLADLTRNLKGVLPSLKGPGTEDWIID